MLFLPTNAASARAKYIFSLAPESELKNIFANINQDIIEAAYNGKLFVTEPQINIDTEPNLKKKVWKALDEAGFNLAETKEKMLIIWTNDPQKIEAILEKELHNEIQITDIETFIDRYGYPEAANIIKNDKTIVDAILRRSVQSIEENLDEDIEPYTVISSKDQTEVKINGIE